MKTLHILTAILLLPLLSFSQQLGIGVSPSYVATHKAQDTSTPTPSGALTMTADVDAEQVVILVVIFTGSLTVDWGDGSEPEALVTDLGEWSIYNTHEYASADAYDISITGDLTGLTLLGCGENSLTALDVSDCPSLGGLYCNANSLTESAITTIIGTMVDRTELDAGECYLGPQSETFPQTLTPAQCSALSAINWVEAFVPCETPALTMTVDVEAEQVVSILVIFTGSLTVDWGDGSEPEAMVADGGSYEIFNTHEYATEDDYTITITGDLTALAALGCFSNSLTSLDVSSCTALIILDCSENSLTALDVSSCTALTVLECSSNSLTSLDVSSCTALTILYCSSNSLTESAITALIATMPDLSESSSGACYLMPQSETFPQALTPAQCSALSAINWVESAVPCGEPEK